MKSSQPKPLTYRDASVPLRDTAAPFKRYSSTRQEILQYHFRDTPVPIKRYCSTT